MAINPLDPHALSSMSQQLSDITTKLTAIKDFEMIDVSIRLPNVRDVNAEIDKINRSFESSVESARKVGKVFQHLGADFEKITRHFHDLRIANEKLRTKIRDTNGALSDLSVAESHLKDKMDRQSKTIMDQVDNLLTLEKKLASLEKQERQGTVTYEKLKDEYKELKKASKELQEEYKDEEKHMEKIQDDRKELHDQLKDLIVRQKEYEKVLEENDEAMLKREALKKRAINATVAAGEKGFAMLAKGGLAVLTTAFKLLEDGVLAAFRVQEKFTGSFGSFAQSIGAASSGIGDITNKIKGSYMGALGDLGMSLEAITAEYSGFYNALQFTGNSFDKTSDELISKGKLIGLTGNDIGSVSKAFMFMDMKGEDLAKTIALVGKASEKLKINASALAKNLLVAGKDMLLLFGKEFQSQMAESIMLAQKMGVEAQELQSFHKMTRSFSQVTESIAKMNTMFGTHLNAMEIFAERDPTKQLQMITREFGKMGKSIEAIASDPSSVEFLSQGLRISPQAVQALLRGGKAVDEYTKEMEAAKAAEMDWNKAMAAGKTTLVNMQRFFDSIAISIQNFLAPLLQGLNLGKEFEGLSGVFGKLQAVIQKFFKTLGDSPVLQEKMRDLGLAISGAFTKLEEWIKTPEFKKWIDDLALSVAGMFTVMKDNANSFFEGLKTVGQFLPTIVNLGKLLANNWAEFLALWAVFKGVGVAISFGTALAEMGIAAGGASAGFGALAAGVWAALWPILLIIGALYAAYKAYKFLSSEAEGGGKASLDFHERVQQVASEYGMSAREAEEFVRKEDADKKAKAASGTTGAQPPAAPPAPTNNGVQAPSAPPASAMKPSDVLDFGGGTGDESHFNKLAPGIQQSVLAAGQEYHAETGKKLKVNSGWRSIEEQQSMREQAAPGTPVAKPGTSRHERGVAVDIQNYGDQKAVAALARQGLYNPIGGDPQHFQRKYAQDAQLYAASPMPAASPGVAAAAASTPTVQTQLTPSSGPAPQAQAPAGSVLAGNTPVTVKVFVNGVFTNAAATEVIQETR